MVNEYLSSLTEDMNGTLAHLAKELGTVRTGRASPAILHSVQVHVSSYGATMPINQLATINAPDARLLVVQPWDKTTLSDVEKAIGSAGLGLNPSNDGQVIRIPVPALTGDRRKELTRRVGKIGEDAKIRARQVRRDYNDTFKAMEADKDISEDELKRVLKLVQDATNDAVARIDAEVKAKEAEILDG